MSNFLTQGRTALLGALKDDEEINSRVRTYLAFGPGLKRRAELTAALCPALTLTPGRTDQAQVANVERELAQRLAVEVAVAGQDVAPCEELAALVLDRVLASSETCLGLSGEGLTALRARSVQLEAQPAEDAAHLIWKARVAVELLWRRR
ncbi:MAG: hypothetical protein J7M08_08605 [Planctomycetes bacterium]|nr:hypothetical protein [Planctomycetota bacterium]